MGRRALPLRAGAVLFTTAIGAGLAAAPAQAAATGVVSLPSGTYQVRYTAAGKAANKVVVTRSGRTVTVDDRVRLKAGKGCKAVKGDATRIRCTFSGTIDQWSLLVDLGDRSDSLVNDTGLRMRAHGGTGNDTLRGGTFSDDLFGGTGNDRVWGNGGRDHLEGNSGADRLSGGGDHDLISGGTGNDTLWGGSGIDRLTGGSGTDALYGGADGDDLDGGTGADLLRGDSGTDHANYGSRRDAVFADLDGARGDDGAKGERDTIAGDVEGLVGGLGNDVLTGNNGPNTVNGGSGADRITGGGGNDRLSGGGGRDVIDGGAGDDHVKPDFTETESGDDGPDVIDPIAADVVRGGSGVDTVDYSDRQRNPVIVDLDGAPGDDGRSGEGDTVGADVENVLGTIYGDRLTGNASANDLRGGAGNDVLLGLDGADRLWGEAGDDDLSGEDPSGVQAADQLDGGSQYSAGDLCRAFPSDVLSGCER
ncbi:calcium-binding protein [Actinoplanes flavus]|uniref:Calcium-binding protein n=1 Tax=Actinoplanes flavus TaxID=2820290 RepID=A0ABS3UMD6_9ACTN|nr:calcium-binding protein [Actinoplanes flavus]MBO3739616.1 calcium-binding protein [Actinoplanes flavus]